MKAIERCRICGNKNLFPVIDLGELCFTGIFPKSESEVVPKGRLELVKCFGTGSCGLLQLKHSFDMSLLYGKNYGYRSGLNPSMISHLHGICEKVMTMVDLKKGDLIIDIGSNDGTLLKAYPKGEFQLMGIDPVGEKFRQFYREDIILIPTFFSLEKVKEVTKRKAKVITSIAMFYDLEAPLQFMKEIYELLDEDGIWLFEQSYTPKMILSGAYDTICHEHLDYYCLRQIKWMTDRVGFKIVDIDFSEVNGGSFSIVVSKKGRETEKVKEYLTAEERWGLDDIERFKSFEEKVKRHKEELLGLLERLKRDGANVAGYGASTKGNVILQYCGIGPELLPYIAEVNEDKFGSYTPGTKIKIVSEDEMRKMAPQYLLVLPWHFKGFILEKERDFLKKGGKFIFPLPDVEVYAL